MSIIIIFPQPKLQLNHFYPPIFTAFIICAILLVTLIIYITHNLNNIKILLKKPNGKVSA